MEQRRKRGSKRRRMEEASTESCYDPLRNLSGAIVNVKTVSLDNNKIVDMDVTAASLENKKIVDMDVKAASLENNKIVDMDVKAVSLENKKIVDMDVKAASSENQKSVDMDVKLWSRLCEELQEAVLAKLPLPELFRVPLLSKSWRFTFQSPGFRDMVNSVASRWPFYCPVHLCREGLVGFDVVSQRWQKLFTLSYLPYVPEGPDVMTLCSSAGSLICFAQQVNKTNACEKYAPNLSTTNEYEMYVTNVVTREWKQLPQRPAVYRKFSMYYLRRPHVVQVVPVGMGAYKVILITVSKVITQVGHRHFHFWAQIYDSTTSAWTQGLALPAGRNIISRDIYKFVYLDQDGLFFFLMRALDDDDDSSTLRGMTLNLSQGKGIASQISSWSAGGCDFGFCELLVCGSHVMLVSRQRPVEGLSRLLVCRLDVDFRKFSDISTGPQVEIEGVSRIDLVTGAGECVYFGSSTQPSNPIIVFNIHTKEWSSLSPAISFPGFSKYLSSPLWTKFCFQPSLNPFLKLA